MQDRLRYSTAAGPPTHHLVVIRQQYLDRMLDGRKRVECRLSKRRKPPFELVAPGDLLWFKLPSRPIHAFAVADACWFCKFETPDSLREFIKPHEADISAEAGYFEDAARWARYASLIRIRSIARIGPIDVRKSDQRAWVVLDRTPHPGMSIDNGWNPSPAGN